MSPHALMNKSCETIQDYLPESIQYLMTIISVESVVLLVKTYGGTIIDVPYKAKPNHRLAELIGISDFKKLVAVFASNRLEIPACSRFIALMLAFSVLQEKRSDGCLRRTLALKYGISERGVTKRLRRAEAAEKTIQLDPLTIKLMELFNDSS